MACCRDLWDPYNELPIQFLNCKRFSKSLYIHGLLLGSLGILIMNCRSSFQTVGGSVRVTTSMACCRDLWDRYNELQIQFSNCRRFSKSLYIHGLLQGSLGILIMNCRSSFQTVGGSVRVYTSMACCRDLWNPYNELQIQFSNCKKFSKILYICGLLQGSLGILIMNCRSSFQTVGGSVEFIHPWPVAGISGDPYNELQIQFSNCRKFSKNLYIHGLLQGSLGSL